MKKLVLTLGLAVLVITANAQIQQGTTFFGGSAGLTVTGGKTKTGAISVDNPTTVDLNITPTAGYYYTDNLAFTAGIGYSRSSSKTSNEHDQEIISNLFSIAPGARYNMPVTEKFGAFLQGSVLLGFGSTTNTVTTGGVKHSTDQSDFRMDIGVSPGILYFVRDNVALEATYGRLGYDTRSSTTESTGGDIKHTNNTFDLGLNTRSIGFGFLCYF